MQRKKLLFVLMLVLTLFAFSINTAFAQGEYEGPPPSAFTGTVVALSLAFILGLGGIILYGTSKGSPEKLKGKSVKNPRSNKNKNITVSKSNKPVKAGESDKKNLRKQLLSGEIDEKTYLEELNKLK